MIQVQEISKSYGDKKVLDAVSAEIPKGSITSFIGANGAGKSTLLGIISRLFPADSGEVWIDGKSIADYTTGELARKISYLKQQNNLQIRLTVEELVAFGRYPYSKGKLTKADKVFVYEAMEYMGLLPLRKRFLDQLSGGERQRAFIAMVIAQDTDYIFLDEPLNNLDMKHSVEIMRMLRRLCREKGKTVVIVIHDINFASCYSDYILALRESDIYINDAKDQVITPEVLQAVYDMEFRVYDIADEKICVYYDETCDSTNPDTICKADFSYERAVRYIAG